MLRSLARGSAAALRRGAAPPPPDSLFRPSATAALLRQRRSAGSAQPCAARRACATLAPDAAASAAALPYQLVTFYCLVPLADSHAEVARHRAWIAAQAPSIRGRIYLCEQGINAQLSGLGQDAESYARWATGEGAPFSGARVSVYPVREQAFPRLTLRYKSGLVQMEGGTLHLPVTDPAQRAVELSAREWHERLGEASRQRGDTGAAAAPPVVLDVRNGYEWDCGRFEGAVRPPAESFRETLGCYSAEGGPLAGVPKEAPVYMYCTGGIRCDFYSAALRKEGYTNLYTLKGGVQAYLDSEQGPATAGSEKSAWKGQLFVFDSRLAMTPSGTQAAPVPEESAKSGLALTCHCCGGGRASAPHRNCPNVDCNRLFLVCPACLQSHGGFCSTACASATHVRPALLLPGERYARWNHYADGGAASTAARRGDGRRLRKQRTRERRREEAYEMAIQALVQAELGTSETVAAPAPAAEGAESEASARGTAARRQRAARIAAAIGGGAPESGEGVGAAFAEMRERMRAEAAARIKALQRQGSAA